MTGRQIFERYGKLIQGAVFAIAIIPRRWREVVFIHMRNVHGKKGELLRYLLFSGLQKGEGKNISIKEGVYLHNIKELSCGDNVSIHEMCYIDAYGGLILGKNIAIAHGTSIVTFNHSWDNPDVPIKYNPTNKAKIVIEDDVWIGCGVRIMAGVRVGTRSVIAAGSVVTKDVPPFSVVAGVPARVIKSLA